MAGPWLLGIEIGGTKLQLGIGQGRGEILALKRLHVDPTGQASGIRDQISEAFPELVAEAGIDRAERSAPRASASAARWTPIAAASRRSYQVDGWDDFPLADWIREELGVPAVVVHNDADTAGLAEARFGAGIGLSPLLYMTIGSGIGGALIIDDRIYRGFGKGAGEIGHLLVPVEDAGTDRLRPDVMELEQVASGWAIARAGQELLESGGLAGADLAGLGLLEQADGREPRRITGWMVAEAARQGDPRSRPRSWSGPRPRSASPSPRPSP